MAHDLHPDVLVSVGLPTYNRASTLGAAIESVLKQSHANLELIISDNSSTDGTQELCERYSAQDPRVRYIRQETNLGMAGNFNAVLHLARAEYFMWISDDDWMDERYLEICLEEMQLHPDYAVVCGVSKFYREGVHESDGETVQLTQNDPATRVLQMYRTFVLGCFIYGLFRRDCLRQGYPQCRAIAEDVFLVASVLYQGKGATIGDAFMHRAATGVSSNPKSIAREYGERGTSYWVLDYRMARGAQNDVLINAAYELLPPARRRLFAGRVFRAFWCNFIRRRTGNLLRWWRDNLRHTAIGSTWRVLRKR